jgi:hypothetical protein
LSGSLVLGRCPRKSKIGDLAVAAPKRRDDPTLEIQEPPVKLHADRA